MKNKHEFELMPLSWCKRRPHTKDEQVVESFIVNGFEKIDNHYCTMSVLLTNGDQLELRSRINVNDQNGRWTVHGSNPHGLSILVKLI